MDWFSLSLICALSLATSDAFAKKYLSDYSAWELLLVRFFIPGILLIPWLILYPIGDVPLVFWGWFALLMPLELLAMSLYVRAIRDAPLSQTLPYLAFTPVFNIATGWIVLGEKLSLQGCLGILLVVGGAYFLNISQLKGNATKNWLEPLKAITHQQGARRMLLAAFVYSITSVGGKAAMAYVDPMSFGALYFVVLGWLTVCVVAIAQPQAISILKTKINWHLLVGGLMAVMVVTHFLALSMVETAYMIAIKRISMLFGILYGAYLFHEHGLGRNVFAAVVMITGVGFILLGK